MAVNTSAVDFTGLQVVLCDGGEPVVLESIPSMDGLPEASPVSGMADFSWESAQAFDFELTPNHSGMFDLMREMSGRLTGDQEPPPSFVDIVSTWKATKRRAPRESTQRARMLGVVAARLGEFDVEFEMVGPVRWSGGELIRKPLQAKGGRRKRQGGRRLPGGKMRRLGR